MNLSALLNHKVTIQAPASGIDAAGQPLTAWTDVTQVWANIRHLNGTETIKAGSQASTVQASIRIRYRTDLNTGMRVVHGATIYAIKALLPDELGRVTLDLVCEVIA